MGPRNPNIPVSCALGQRQAQYRKLAQLGVVPDDGLRTVGIFVVDGPCGVSIGKKRAVSTGFHGFRMCDVLLTDPSTAICGTGADRLSECPFDSLYVAGLDVWTNPVSAYERG